MHSCDSSLEKPPSYTLDYVLAETDSSYYATIDGLTIEPVWIPKTAIIKENYSVKDWWFKLFKEGKTEWKKEEKKMVQSKLTSFTE